MELSLKIVATQLKKGNQEFLGQEVKSPKENPFVHVPYAGTLLLVNEGFWLVEYHDGTREVWSTEQIEANTSPIEPETEPIGESEAIEEVLPEWTDEPIGATVEEEV